MDDNHSIQPTELQLRDPPDTKWPRVIGIISLIYAIVGLLCQASVMMWSLASQWLLSLGGLDVQMPAILKYWGAATAVVVSIVGMVLLFAALGLLRRRRSGVSLHKAWAFLRVLLLAIGATLTILLLPAQLEFQKAVQEAGNQQAIEGGRPDLTREFDEEGAWRTAIIMTGVSTGVFAIYPVFIAFYLSRRKIAEEIEHWA